MATSSTSSALSLSLQQRSLQDAIYEFQAVLDGQQLRELKKMKTVPDVDAILVFTAELDNANRTKRGPSCASRLYTLLLSVRNFCAVVDTFVSSNPETAAIVWGSVRLTMQICMGFTSYYETISSLFMKLGKLCPLFAEYQALYPSEVRLQKSLLDFHATIIRCCRHVLQVIRRPWHQHAAKVVWASLSSIDNEFKPFVEAIQKNSDTVKEEIHLAQRKAEIQDHKIQEKERIEAAKNRSLISKILPRAEIKLSEFQKKQLQRDERDKRRRERNLVDALSKIDHLRPLKQSRQKRFQNTSSWIFKTAEFHRWLDGDSPVLWMSGKIGSGKTIATGSIIDHVLVERGSRGSLVSLFFIEAGSLESRNVEAIFRSILKQRLSSAAISENTYNELLQLGPSQTCLRNGASDLHLVLKMLATAMPPSQRSYILIDGLDECDKSNLKEILWALSNLVSSSKNVSLFISSRFSIQDDLRRHFAEYEHLSMDCQSANLDIEKYIEGIIEEKIEDQTLVVGDQSLVHDIKSALINGTQGMFLWAFFQIEEICLQHCDEDIRQALSDLPPDLAGTYKRALRRIMTEDKGKGAQRVFPWIAASKRPLSLDELREAIAVEIGQDSLNPARLFNNIRSITSWCCNLVQIDEEDELVQFSHPSIKEFLVERHSFPESEGLHVDLEDADHMIGEVCITYLNFVSFKNTLAIRPRDQALPHPIHIAEATLKSSSKLAATLTKLHPIIKSKSQTSKPLDFKKLVRGDHADDALEDLNKSHPFLEYAAEYWILHTKAFEESKSQTWNSFETMILHGVDNAEEPWKLQNKSTVTTWAFEANHLAILRVILAHGDEFRHERRSFAKRVIYYESRNTFGQQVFDMVLKYDGNVFKETLLVLFVAESNHKKIKMLLSVGVNPDAPSHVDQFPIEQPLRMAAEKDDIVTLTALLNKGADTNIRPGFGDTPRALHAAADAGHIEAVTLLLAAGCDPNEWLYIDGGILVPTPLQRAVSNGHAALVFKLLSSGAHVNVPPSKFMGTPLQIAATQGDQYMVEMLLDFGAKINAIPADWRGLTALQAAALESQADIVQMLLRAGASIALETPGGLSSIDVAIASKHSQIMEMLIPGKTTSFSLSADRLLKEVEKRNDPALVNIIRRNWDL